MSAPRFVCRTTRGLERWVTAATPQEAWAKAQKRNRIEMMWNEQGEAWGESATRGAIRLKDADIDAPDARSLFARVCP